MDDTVRAVLSVLAMPLKVAATVALESAKVAAEVAKAVAKKD